MQQTIMKEQNELVEALERLDATFDEEAWHARLSPRKRDEAGFHDWARDPSLETPDQVQNWEDNHPNMKFYDTTQASARHREDWIRAEAPGRVFLDYACGRGNLATAAAQAGASLSIGIDISPVSVAGCRTRAEEAGLTNLRFVVGDCERTGLPDNSIDRIITAGCLHHLDLSYAFPELRRILKPGGRIYAIEALAYNPAIQLYRRLTPKLRTAFEKDHILSLRELKFASRFFDVENVRYFHLASIAATPFRRTRAFPAILRTADAVDNAILRIPGLRRMAWQFSFELVKRADDE